MTMKHGTVMLHRLADDVIPFADSEELVRNSGMPATALIEVGTVDVVGLLFWAPAHGDLPATK